MPERGQAEKKALNIICWRSIELRAYLKNHDFTYQYWDEDYSVNPFTIEQCLQNFITLDVLDEDNKFVCDKCVYTKAGKLVWFKFRKFKVENLSNYLTLSLRINIHNFWE